MNFLTVFFFMFYVNISNAAYKMMPGLWENSITIKSQSGKVEEGMNKMQAEMAKMPKEQRKMMEAMMANKGIGVGGSPSSVKVCISKEQAENLEIPQKQNGNCTHEVMKRTSNTVKMKFSCSGEPSTSGEGEFTLSSPKAYTGKTIVNTISHGKSERMDMNQKGKWLSADCGDIKPVSRTN